MPSSNVHWAPPLTRLPPWFPGQVGVRGSDSELGLRLNTEGVVFYVDPNHAEADDNNDGTNANFPLATVANALTRCQPFRGDVIAVMANNSWIDGDETQGYVLPIAEEVIVTIPGISIVGLSQSSCTGVVWTPASDGGTCITILAIDVLVEGFIFDEGIYSGCDAIAAVWTGAAAFGDHPTIRHCYFSPTVDIAISLDFVWYADIHNNVFMQCDDKGITVVQPGSGARWLLIHENIFHDVHTCAVELPETDYSHIWGNSIYNANAKAGAAATDEGIITNDGITPGSHNQIFDNYFSCLDTVPANGDWDDLNTGVATDAWIDNHLLDAMNTANPT